MFDNSELARLNSFKDRKCVKNVKIKYMQTSEVKLT